MHSKETRMSRQWQMFSLILLLLQEANCNRLTSSNWNKLKHSSRTATYGGGVDVTTVTRRQDDGNSLRDDAFDVGDVSDLDDWAALVPSGAMTALDDRDSDRDKRPAPCGLLSSATARPRGATRLLDNVLSELPLCSWPETVTSQCSLSNTDSCSRVADRTDDWTDQQSNIWMNTFVLVFEAERQFLRTCVDAMRGLYMLQ